MIIVLGSVRTDAGNRAAIEAESIAHCTRSRAEPGCIAHNCHFDAEDPDRLVFIEKWVDAEALRTHFTVPDSHHFVAALRKLAKEPPVIEIFSAEPVDFAALAKP